MNPFRFTDGVRAALARTRDEAAQMNYEYIGTEHILLGLISDPTSLAVAMLDSQAITPDEVRAAVHEQAKPGRTQPTGPDLPYSARAKRVLEEAMGEARNLGDEHVHTGHLLLGLVRDKRDLGASVLNSLGFSRDAARNDMLALLPTHKETVSAPPPPPELPGSHAADLLERIATSERFAPVFKQHGVDLPKLLDDLRKA